MLWWWGGVFVEWCGVENVVYSEWMCHLKARVNVNQVQVVMCYGGGVVGWGGVVFCRVVWWGECRV